MPRQYTRNRVECTCQTCGKVFFTVPSRVAAGNGKFCSRACVGSRIADRFWPRVDKSGACWLWTGPCDTRGYGIIGKGGKQNGLLRTHRLSWELHHGPIAAGMNVLHRCDTPRCVRPDHLFLGTHKDNSIDMVLKDRQGLAKLTVADIPVLRELRAQGLTYVAIAQRYGIAPVTAQRAIVGETWSHVVAPVGDDDY